MTNKMCDLEVALGQTEHSLKDLTEKHGSAGDSLNNVMEEVAELQATANYHSSWMQTTEHTLGVFQRRFQNIKPLLNLGAGINVGNLSRNTTNAVMDELLDRSQGLESQLLAQKSPDSADSNQVVYRRLLDLEEKTKILENRVVGAGVQMGNIVFQSFEDLLSWV